MEIHGFSVSQTDIVTKKNSKKLYTNLSKCHVENCAALSGLYLTSTRNRSVRSVPAGQGEISSQQTEMM